MAYKTLLEFATDRNLFILLAKERAKYLKRNDNAKTHKLDKSTDIFELLHVKYIPPEGRDTATLEIIETPPAASKK